MPPGGLRVGAQSFTLGFFSLSSQVMLLLGRLWPIPRLQKPLLGQTPTLWFPLLRSPKITQMASRKQNPRMQQTPCSLKQVSWGTAGHGGVKLLVPACHHSNSFTSVCLRGPLWELEVPSNTAGGQAQVSGSGHPGRKYSHPFRAGEAVAAYLGSWRKPRLSQIS